MRMSTRQGYGQKGELWALTEFQARGHEARLVSGWFDKFDIVLNGVLPVEVKISRSCWRTIRPGYKRQTWFFDVARIPQDQDFLLLLICEDSFGQFWPYLVASCYVFGRRTISITSHPRQYKGRWAETLNRWSVIDWLINIRQQLGQMPLGTGDNLYKSPEWGQNNRSAGTQNALSPVPIGGIA